MKFFFKSHTNIKTFHVCKFTTSGPVLMLFKTNVLYATHLLFFRVFLKLDTRVFIRKQGRLFLVQYIVNTYLAHILIRRSHHIFYKLYFSCVDRYIRANIHVTKHAVWFSLSYMVNPNLVTMTILFNFLFSVIFSVLFCVMLSSFWHP